MQFPMDNLVDRGNLGLLPSSEECWSVACAALKTASGGWLHIHGNVNTKVSQDSLLLQHLELEDKYKHCPQFDAVVLFNGSNM